MLAEMRGAISRASKSVVVPLAYGTIMRNGREGKPCALAGAAARAVMATHQRYIAGKQAACGKSRRSPFAMPRRALRDVRQVMSERPAAGHRGAMHAPTLRQCVVEYGAVHG